LNGPQELYTVDRRFTVTVKLLTAALDT